MGNEGGKAEQMGPELRGKGCENFPILFFFFFPPSVCMGMSGNHSGRASTGVLGLFTPVKDIGNMKSSDSDQKSEFQLLACFKNILVYL